MLVRISGAVLIHIRFNLKKHAIFHKNPEQIYKTANTKNAKLKISYDAQGIPQIDAEIAQKGHFRMETN